MEEHSDDDSINADMILDDLPNMKLMNYQHQFASWNCMP